MYHQLSSALNLLMFSFSLMSTNHISAKVTPLNFEPETGANIWLEQVFGSHAPYDGRSRVARSTSGSLLADWQTANEAFGEMKNSLFSTDAAVHCKQAVGFVNMTSVRQMDENLKVMIVGTLRAFKRDPQSMKTWDNIMATMKNNPLLEEVEGQRIHRTDSITKTTYRVLIPRVDLERGAEFRNFFSNLLSDSVIERDTIIDVNALAEKFGETAKIDSLWTLLGRNSWRSIHAFDLGVLRFPSIESPYMEIYRIQIDVFRRSIGVCLTQYDDSRVDGIFDSAKFKPRESVMAMLRSDIKAKVNADIDVLFP